MPPKRQISINIDINGGTLYLNGSAVTTVYDTRSCAWFKSNDVASALGYANASTSVSQMICDGDKKSFKDICPHKDPSTVECNSRNVFINQRGLMEFLSARDTTCDILKIRNISQSLNRSANDRSQRTMCSPPDEIQSRIAGAQKQNVTGMISARASGARSDHSTIGIDVRGKTLFLNGFPVATVYDTRSCAWFKSNDVAEALGYANASRSVTGQISSNNKIAFNDISLHKDSPQIPAHSRNIFINQSGLMSFLLDLHPSCDAHKIQTISLSMKNNGLNAASQLGSLVSNASQHSSEVIPRKTENPGSLLFINGQPVGLIVDVSKQGWFKVSDIAAALGFANASSSVSKLVPDKDKKPLRDIAIHEDSPAVDADPRNIFINRKGLMEVLHAKRREAQATRVSTGFPRGNSANLSASDKVVLQALYSCFKNFNRPTPDLTLDYPTPNINDSSSKNVGLRISPSCTNTSIPTQPRDSSAPSSRSLSYYTASAHEYDSCGYLEKGYIIIEIEPGHLPKIIQSTVAPECGSNESPVWMQKVHSPKRLLSVIKDLLCDPCSAQSDLYSLPSKQLAVVVSRICLNFEKTLKTVYELTSRISRSSQTPATPEPLSKDQIASLTLHSRTGEWIYIAASIPYAQRNVFKVGSTEDRLAKRLAAYQSGRLNEDRFHFFKVFPVHNCKKVDNLIGFFLRPWAQTHEKLTEMYMLDFETLCNCVSKIIDYYENSFEYVFHTRLHNN